MRKSNNVLNREYKEMFALGEQIRVLLNASDVYLTVCIPHPDPDYYSLIRHATSHNYMLSGKKLEQTFPIPRLPCSRRKLA